MPAQKLTKRALDSARPAAAEYHLWDTEVKGFGVRVQPSGRRTFVFKCRPGGGRGARQRKLTIGEYGPLTLDQARTLARRYVGDIAEGRDPGAARDGRRARSRAALEAPTLIEAADAFFVHARAHCKKDTAREYERIWKRKVAPELGRFRVEEVTTQQIAGLHRRMSATPYAANRMLSVLGTFFTFAEQEGLRARHSHPVRDVTPFPEEARERFLSLEELKRLGDVLDRALVEGLPPAPSRRRPRKDGATAKHRPKSADSPKPANPYAVAALRFLVLSGMREREALTLRWADVDLERRRVTLSDTKTGRSVRPLGAGACALLAELPRVEGSPYAFPGRTPDRPLVEINRLWYAARHAAGIDDVRLHDLRHSFASIMIGDGASVPMVGKALGHKNAATTARYAHLADDPLQTAVDRSARTVAGLLGLTAPQQGDDAQAGDDRATGARRHLRAV